MVAILILTRSRRLWQAANPKWVRARVDDKNYLLEFQSEIMEQEARRLSRELQQVVDEERLLSIVPRTLEGFYRVCFLLDRIVKQPDAPGVWLVYLMSFFNDAMSAVDLARYIYALDFLYFKCRSVQKNERIALGKRHHTGDGVHRATLCHRRRWNVDDRPQRSAN